MGGSLLLDCRWSSSDNCCWCCNLSLSSPCFECNEWRQSKQALACRNFEPKTCFDLGGHFFLHTKKARRQGCQIFLGPNLPKWEKTNYTKRPKIIPNGRKIFQMVIKYKNIFYSKALQIFTKIGIFCLKTNHLATLAHVASSNDNFFLHTLFPTYLFLTSLVFSFFKILFLKHSLI
jgi:hypothetical protein